MKVIITGPRSVGKTTISKIVAKKSKLKYISSDEIGEKAFEKYGGLDRAIKLGVVEKIINRGGYNLITDVLEKENNFIFDLSGGSISSIKMMRASEKVRETAKEKANLIVGLLPSKGINESIKILFEREKERVHFKNLDKKELLEKVSEHCKKFPKIFNEFCDFIIYTENKTPEEISEEIVRKIPSRGN